MSKVKIGDSEIDVNLWIPAMTRTVLRQQEIILYLSIGLVANLLATTYLLFNLWSR